jgi:hypothetical protein
MKKYYARALFFVMVSTLLFGCAAPQVQPTKSLFSPSQLQADQYQPKVDNFVVILDTSSSMSDCLMSIAGIASSRSPKIT